MADQLHQHTGGTVGGRQLSLLWHFAERTALHVQIMLWHLQSDCMCAPTPHIDCVTRMCDTQSEVCQNSDALRQGWHFTTQIPGASTRPHSLVALVARFLGLVISISHIRSTRAATLAPTSPAAATAAVCATCQRLHSYGQAGRCSLAASGRSRIVKHGSNNRKNSLRVGFSGDSQQTLAVCVGTAWLTC